MCCDLRRIVDWGSRLWRACAHAREERKPGLGCRGEVSGFKAQREGFAPVFSFIFFANATDFVPRAQRAGAQHCSREAGGRVCTSSSQHRNSACWPGGGRMRGGCLCCSSSAGQDSQGDGGGRRTCLTEIRSPSGSVYLRWPVVVSASSKRFATSAHLQIQPKAPCQIWLLSCAATQHLSPAPRSSAVSTVSPQVTCAPSPQARNLTAPSPRRTA